MSQSHPSDPQRFGPYRLLAPLGRGGMGAVYRAEHVETGARVALKTALAAHAEEVAAIRTEIEALRRVDHDGIVRILDAGVEGFSPWYAMELLEGQTARDFQRALWSQWLLPASDVVETAATDAITRVADPSTRPMAGRRVAVRAGAPAGAGQLGEALLLVRRLCGPLAHLHELGIVHRDLKPANVFVRPDGWPVLMDFGLASRWSAAGGREVLETAGALAGTAAYMAPEQVRRERVDARSDLYALGCVLYELVAGQPPFGGFGVARTMEQHLNEVPPPPSARVEQVDAALDDLVMRLLAKRARDRIGHADDVAAAIGALGVGGDEPAPVAGARRGYLYRPELAGRDDLVELLDRRAEALSSGAGGCVLIGGESGVGKTSLLAEAARVASLRQVKVVVGECQPLGGVALEPLRPVLRAIFDRAVDGGAQAPARLFGARARVLVAIEPELERLAGYDQWPAPAVLPADAARERLLHDFREAIAAFATEQPLLIVIDDLQWADALTLQLLHAARGGWFERVPVLVVGSYRVDEQPDLLRDLLAVPGVERIELGRLDRAAVGAMVGDMLALPAVPSPLVEFLAARSEGNPFFVAEYLRTAVAERLLERRAGRWVLGGDTIDHRDYARLPLPGSLRELVERRLAGLPAPARGLAETAAVFGREIDARLLLRAAPGGEAAAMDAVRELLTRQVLERVEHGRYRFVHDKLREIAYDGIPASRRAELHRTAAATLESVFATDEERSPHHAALARHWLAAGDRRAAIRWLGKAAEDAARVFADGDLASYLATALELDALEGGVVEPQRRQRWRSDLGTALRLLGRQDEARAQLEQAAIGMGLPIATGSMARTAGLAVRELVGRRSLRRAPVERRASDPRALAGVAAYNYLAMIAYHRNDVPSQLFYTFAALRLAPRTGASLEAAHLYGSSANIIGFLGLGGLARRYGALSRRIGEAAAHPLAAGIAYQYTGHLAAFLGDLPAFESEMNTALEVYTRAGHQRFREEALTNLGYLYSFRGELDRSLDTFRSIEQSGRARDDAQTTSWGMVGQGRALAMTGKLAEALALFEQAERIVCDDLGRLDCPAMKSLILARLGRGDEAEAEAQRALEIVRSNTPTSYTTLWSFSSAIEAVFVLWDGVADSNGAGTDSAAAGRHRASVAGLLTSLRRFGRMIPLARPRLALWLGALARREGRSRAARAQWRRAIEGARRIGLPIDEAKARLELGRAIGGEEGAAHLRAALATFERAGLVHEASETRRALDAGASTH